MFILAYRFRRKDADEVHAKAYPRESGQALRMPSAARLVCKWENAGQGRLACKWQQIGPSEPAAAR
jgi:hypothetical protein